MSNAAMRSMGARMKAAAGAVLAIAAVASAPACGATDAASCDAACANGFGQCNANPDMCLSSCQDWKKGAPDACSSQVSDLLRCWHGATDLDCTASTFVSPSCSTQESAFATCAGTGSGVDAGVGPDSGGGGSSGAGSSSGGVQIDASTSGSGGGSSSGTSRDGGSSGVSADGGGAADAGYSCSNLPVVFGGATSACTQCVASHCCSADLACGNSSDCLAEIDCFGPCSTGSCYASCATSHATGQTYSNTLALCVSAQCGTTCYGATTNACNGTTGWGNTCGINLGADPARLFLCNSGAVAGSVVCQNGCYPQNAGQNDYCVGTDPCVSNVFGAGQQATYCGASLSPNASQNTLYTCSGPTTVSTMICARGCLAAPPGQVDQCNP
ncbi:MAG: hypothetical protein ACRENE_06545 [Polyangiaceae bacterium]